MKEPIEFEYFELPHDAHSYSLLSLREDILKRHTELAPVLETCVFAINLEYVDFNFMDSTMIHANDEVAIIPPVSGG